MDEELVVIAKTNDLVEAEMWQNALETKGFEVYLADDNIVGVMNLLANAVGGIKVKVPASEAQEATQFLEEFNNAEIIFDDESAAEDKF